MADSFEIGGHTVDPGQVHAFDLPMPRLYTHTELTMPVHVIRGKRDGPRLLLCAVIHGDELNGIEIIRRVMARLEVDKLNGTVVCVPVVNVFGMITQSRYLPDRRDLNRSFPGSSSGPLAGRVAHIFLNQIVRQCTHGVDFHTAAVPRTNLPQIRAVLSDEETVHLARVFGAPIVVNSALRDGSLRASANADGIKLLVFEGGAPLAFQEDVIEMGVRGVMRLMASLGMRKKAKSAPERTPLFIPSTKWIRARASGILRLSVKNGSRVTKGQEIGIISDPLDEERSLVKAPETGIIIGHTTNPLVHRGDAVANLGIIAEA